jgi:hypothetical protein
LNHKKQTAICFSLFLFAMALSITKELFPQQFSTNIRVLVIDHDINLLNAIEKLCYQSGYSGL